MPQASRGSQEGVCGVTAAVAPKCGKRYKCRPKELPQMQLKATLMVSADSSGLGVRRPGLELRLCPEWLVTLDKVMEILRASVSSGIPRGTSWDSHDGLVCMAAKALRN